MRNIIRQTLKKLQDDFNNDKVFTTNKFKAALNDVKIEADDKEAKRIRRLLNIAMCDMQVYSRLKTGIADNLFIIDNLASELSTDYMISDNRVAKMVIECIAELLGYEPIIETNNEAEYIQQPNNSGMLWYTLSTFSGYETVAEKNLKKTIEDNNLQNRVCDIKVHIPTETASSVYIYVKMIYSDDLWHIITKARGITGIVGSKGRPVPLAPHEVDDMRLEDSADEAGHVRKTQQFNISTDDTQNDYKIGLSYYLGETVEKDFLQAQQFLWKAAIRGNTEAQFFLGELLIDESNINGNLLQAIDWFTKAAENGHAKAQLRLGAAYYNGLGIKKDKKEALYWFHQSAEQGDSEGQYGLGMYYFDIPDYEKSEYWIRKASENGHPEAPMTLGMVKTMLRI